MTRAALLSLLVVLPAIAGEPPGEYYEDSAWGFKVRVPKDWQASAVSADTRWIASKHLGKRELEWQQGTHWERERPEMWVIGFPHGKEGGVTNPHSSYHDFLTGNKGFLQLGNDYTIDEKQTEVGGVKVTTYDVKRTTPGIGRRVVAWVFHFDDIDFAVQFKVLEGRYDDYDTSFRGCLKSFRRIERTKALGGSAALGEVAIRSRSDVAQLPPEKRTKAFKDAVESHFRALRDRLLDGWDAKQTKNFLLLTNADDKFVRATITHTDAVVAHLDKTFGKVGMDYRPPFVLRIFASEDQRQAFGKGDEDFTLVRDIAIYSGKGWVKDNAYEDLNEGLWARWVEDRNPDLEATLPAWLKEGMKKYMRMIRTKGRRITFANDDYDRDEIRLQIKKGAYESLLTMMSAGIVDRGEHKEMDGYERERQQRVVVLWLMRDARGKYKTLVRDFVLAIAEALDAAAAKGEAVSGRRAEILQAAWQATFGGWKDDDWDRLTTAWLNEAQ